MMKQTHQNQLVNRDEVLSALTLGRHLMMKRAHQQRMLNRNEVISAVLERHIDYFANPWTMRLGLQSPKAVPHPYMSLYDRVILPTISTDVLAEKVASMPRTIEKPTISDTNGGGAIHHDVSKTPDESSVDSDSIPPKKRWLSMLKSDVSTTTDDDANTAPSPVTAKRKRTVVEESDPPPPSVVTLEAETAKPKKIRKIGKNYDQWMAMYQRLVEYKNKFGSTRVPQRYKGDPKLGRWVSWTRSNCTDPVRRELLDEIGFEWTGQNPEDWAVMYQRLVEYKKKHGTTKVPKKYREDPKLGTWVHTQRADCKIKDRIDLLNEIGFEWRLVQRHDWMEMFHRLVEYKKKHQTTHVPKRYKADPKLARWVQTQRASCKDPWRVDKLNELGFEWDGRKAISLFF